MAVCFLSLGSNLDKHAKIRECMQLIQDDSDVERVQFSPVYENAAVNENNHVTNTQESFLNLACRIETQLSVKDLFTRCRDWEKNLGRVRNADKFAARPIDIDLVLYDNLIIETELFTIPHPQLDDKAFVLYPMAQLAPELVHPTHQITLREWLDNKALDISGFREIELNER